jgi:hypothetical protein
MWRIGTNGRTYQLFDSAASRPRGTLLDPADPEVRAAIDRTRKILVQMKAVPLIARLDAAAARGSAHAAGSAAGVQATA